MLLVVTYLGGFVNMDNVFDIAIQPHPCGEDDDGYLEYQVYACGTDISRLLYKGEEVDCKRYLQWLHIRFRNMHEGVIPFPSAEELARIGLDPL